MSATLRKHTEVELLGQQIETLQGGKLPTIREVLCVFFHYLRAEGKDVREGATLAINQVLVFWNKTKIPQIQPIKAVLKLESYYKMWRDVMKNNKRETAAQILKRDSFKSKVDVLFDIAQVKAVEIMEKQILKTGLEDLKRALREDLDFYLAQRQPSRPGCIAGIDDALRRREKQALIRSDNRAEKLKCLEIRKENDMKKRKLINERVSEPDFELDSSDNLHNSEPLTPGPSETKNRGRRNILTPELVDALDAAKMSNNQAAKVIAATAHSLGVDISSTNINSTTIRRKRDELRGLSANDMKSSFTPDPILIIHFDGKKVESMSGQGNKERLVIAATGVNTDLMLAAPELPDGKGKTIADCVCDVLEDWDIVKNTKGLNFDTTAANTGPSSGAAVLIEVKLGKELLWFTCRHHIFEIVMEGVYTVVMGPSSGPDVPLFKDFQRTWPSINHDLYTTVTHFPEAAGILDPETRREIVRLAQSHIDVGQPRDDYCELLELTIILVGAAPSKGVKFRKPGPTHHARWMNKYIYVLKLLLFSKQIRLSDEEIRRLSRISVFIVKIYIKFWYSATDAISAPRNDLNFLKELLAFEKVDQEIAQAALHKFSRHCWYLNEEMVGFAIFDSVLWDEMKEEIVNACKTREPLDSPHKNRHLQLRDVPYMRIADLASTRTERFFEILNIKTDFFEVPVDKWESHLSYQQGFRGVNALRVVNDVAERGVKTMQDYNKSVTKDEESYQNLLLNIQSHRKNFPDTKKVTLVKQYKVAKP